MDAENYVDALTLLDRAIALLQTRDTLARVEILYRFRRLRAAFDVWRLQLGQPPPELQRN